MAWRFTLWSVLLKENDVTSIISWKRDHLIKELWEIQIKKKTELIVFGKQDTHTFLNGTLELFLQFQFASENNARHFL